MHHPRPLVSIIIRTDGRRLGYLSRAIASVQNQTYPDIELLVVEDGCPGAVRSALGTVDTTQGLKILAISKSGRSGAGNAGLAASRGALIGFLDDDDELLPRHVETFVNAESPDFDVFHAGSWESRCFGLHYGDMPLREASRSCVRADEVSLPALITHNKIPIQAALFRRTLYETYGGFEEELEHLEDWDLWLRFAQTARFAAINEVTSIYRLPAEPKELYARAVAHASSLRILRRRMLRRFERTPEPKRLSVVPTVSILIVNYNTGPYLTQCLAALTRQTHDDFEVLVLDNDSSDGSLSNAANAIHDRRIRYFELPANIGFAAGNNIAATLARAPWLATLNPDAFAEPDWLACLLDATTRHPKTKMFGSLQLNAKDPRLLDGTGDEYFACGLPWRSGYGHPVGSIPPEGQVFSACAAAALYDRLVFEMLGGFDERYFCYIEDVDLGFRWRLLGGHTIQVPAAKVHHVGGASSAGEGSAFSRFHSARNLIWTFVKNMPSLLFWPLLPLHCAALTYLVLRAAITRRPGIPASAVRAAIQGRSAIWLDRQRLQSGRKATILATAKALSWNPKAYLTQGNARTR